MINLEFLRSFRIFEFAIVDALASVIGVILLSPILTWIFKKFDLNLRTKHWLWLTLPLSLILHLLFGQITPLVKIATDPSSGYIWKLIILFMIFMGLKDIRRVRP